ncbi:hypothetical protein [Leptodesmis sp.]|uniref:hypothetical protein n=1 Tax=Leptodesmis sp. TaxID=3100501 RepID=UPI00405349FE
MVFYEQEFIRLTQLGLSDVYVRSLQQLQQRLGLRDADVAEIQARVVSQQKIRQLQQRLGLRDTDIAETQTQVTTQQKANGASQQQEIEKQRTNTL